MNQAHTIEPWALCHHLESVEHDNSCPCGYRGGIWGGDGEHVVCEMGATEIPEEGSLPRYDRVTEIANAHRIVSCVNACKGLPQDALDGGWTAAGMSAYVKRLEEERAVLLDACRKAIYVIKGREHTGFLESAIAKATA